MTWAASLACVLLLASVAHALDPYKRLSQYMHISWRMQDGTAPGGMMAITQTSDGFLWFTSTSQALYRFDGVQFLQRTLSIDGTTIDHITNVLADPAGGLWAIADRQQILHVKGGVVTSHFPVYRAGTGQVMSADPDSSLWLAMNEQSVERPLCHVSDSAIQCFGEPEGLSVPGRAVSVIASAEGGKWLGGLEGVQHWSGGVSQMYPIGALKSNPGDEVSALAIASDGTVWVGLANSGPGAGLGRLEKTVFRSFVSHGFDGSRLSVSALHIDHDGNVWVGTLGNGLFRVRDDVVEHYGRVEGLSSNSVRALFEDREGLLWVATTNGIDMFRDPPVTTFSAVEGLGLDLAIGVLASRDGTIWVANGESLDHIQKDGTVSSIRWRKGLPGDQVGAMLEDHAGNLWMGVGEAVYVLQHGRFQPVSTPDHQPLGFITALIEDIDGNIWAESVGKSHKLVRIRDFRIVEEFPASQLPRGRLSPDPQGGIWIGTRKRSLALFRKGVLQEFPISSSADFVNYYTTANEDGSVFGAYDDGLVGLRQGKTQRMTKKNGLPCNTVYSIVKDRAKHWWLNTNCGIVELPDSELQRWWANPEAVVRTRLYDTFDGARPGSYGINPVAVSPDGRVWFATGIVVQMLDPSKLPQKVAPAQTYIESVTVDRNEFATTADLKLPPHPRDLQIDYTSPTFLIPQRVKFRYRLEGYDRDWHDAGTRRQAFYTDLPPGKYSFRVMASNSDGVWNVNAAKLDFSVAPAYYQTAWFRVLCVAAVFALLWAFYQWRLRQVRYQFEMTLDARVSERTRIARELHDTLLQSFHGLLLRFHTVSQLLPERPVVAKEKLDDAIEQAAEAITEGRDAVQGLRSSTALTNALAQAIRVLGAELADEMGANAPDFRVDVEGTSRDLAPILRDDVYRIACEAVRNAFHHAQAARIEVEICYDQRQLRLRIRDDGKGIDPRVLEAGARAGHFGLRGLQERAKLVGGKLTVRSDPGAGTELELTIPASVVYASASGRRASVQEKGAS